MKERNQMSVRNQWGAKTKSVHTQTHNQKTKKKNEIKINKKEEEKQKYLESK